MTNTIKFSEFAVEQLDNSAAEIVGLESGINIRSPRFLSWTTATRPASPFNGLLGINTDLQQYEYWNAITVSWTQLDSTTSGTVTSITAGNGIIVSPDPLVSTGAISLDTPVTMANGGTGASLVASVGAITYSGASALALLANPGVSGKILQSVSAAAPAWSVPTYPSTSGGVGKIIISDGTNNLYSTASYPSIATTVGSFLIANGTNWVPSSVLTDGQLFIGSTGVAPVAASLTAGSGVSITPGAGSITISATGSGGTVTSISAGTGITLTPNPIVGVGSVALTVPVSLTNGGTNKALTADNGAIVYSDADSFELLASTATAGKVLQSGSSSAPSWSTPTYPSASGSVGKIIRSDGTNNVYTTATYPDTAGTSGNLLTSDGTNWISSSASGVGSPLTTKGDIYAYSTTNGRFPVAVGDGKILQVSSGSTFGIAYSTPTYPSASGAAGKILRSDGTNNVYSTSTFADTYSASTLLYSNGANTVTGLATANSAVLRTDSSGVPAWSSSMTNGQLLIGSTGATPVTATLSAGPGISISNGAGTITISGTGSGIGWTEVTGTSQAMSADSGYVANNAGLVTLTLPTTAAFGTAISVVGKGAGGWIIALNSGQSIQVGSSVTTTTTGSVASTNRFDSINLICTTANTVWTTLGGVQGILTIV